MILNTLTGKLESVTIRPFFAQQIAMHQGLRKNGWVFNWRKPLKAGHEIYGLYIRRQSDLLGLIALEIKENCVYIHNLEALRGPGQEDPEEDEFEYDFRGIVEYHKKNNRDTATLTDEELKQFIVRRNPRYQETKAVR